MGLDGVLGGLGGAVEDVVMAFRGGVLGLGFMPGDIGPEVPSFPGEGGLVAAGLDVGGQVAFDKLRHGIAGEAVTGVIGALAEGGVREVMVPVDGGQAVVPDTFDGRAGGVVVENAPVPAGEDIDPDAVHPGLTSIQTRPTRVGRQYQERFPSVKP